MVKLSDERKEYLLEDSIKKSIFLINNMIDANDLETVINDKNDALSFGLMKENIYMNVQIVLDYLIKAKHLIMDIPEVSEYE